MKQTETKELLMDLREDTICCSLNDEEIEKVSTFFELVHYPAGAVVFREGDLGDFIGFVVNGKLEVKKQTEFKGNQIIIALLSRGALVGELSVFDRHKRSATVEAVEDTTMMILREEALESLFEHYPHAGIKILKSLIRVLSIRLRKVTDRLTTIF